MSAVSTPHTLLIVDPQAMPGPYLDRETGLLLAFNGEICNYRQQAAAWGTPLGHRGTDARFVLRAWAELGPLATGPHVSSVSYPGAGDAGSNLAGGVREGADQVRFGGGTP